jgi:hypothetical protein
VQIATVEIERMSGDPDWLDKAIRIVEKQIHEMNKKQKDKEPEVSFAKMTLRVGIERCLHRLPASIP